MNLVVRPMTGAEIELRYGDYRRKVITGTFRTARFRRTDGLVDGGVIADLEALQESQRMLKEHLR